MSIKLVTGSFRGVFRVFNVYLNGGIYAVSEDAVFRTKDKSPAIYVNVVNMKGLPQRPCKYKSSEASIVDSENDHVDSPKPKPKTESHYFICCSEESIRIHFNCSATKLHKCMIRKEDGKIVKASISRYQDQSCFVALTNVGLIKIFSLPKLAHIIDIPITNYIPERLKDSIITDDGRVLVSAAQYQYREYTFFKENSFVSLIPKVYRIYNKAKRVPEKPILNSTWWFGGGEAASSHDINELLGKGFTDRKAKQREQPESSRAQDEAQSTASVLADAGRMLNERGEKLNRLQDTVANMEASSAGFLDDIREYNKRMAAKKWYQL
ncbi:hypothetical protein K7432_012725 [Basidiobolus ranarum]|uniref:V-SNARE coiled-coil homology domain-containing protein n=1 Tax=Basidiobolus ranarum TaxID=34480 RepID=A0ABR2VSP9_9FUNG